MRNRKRLIIFFLAALPGLILIWILFYFLYLKKVAIYEPVTIYISGVTPEENKAIEIYSITPLDKKNNIPSPESSGYWFYQYSFHKAIEVVIPVALSPKINTVFIIINSKVFSFKLNEFHSIRISDSKRGYVFPSYTRSEDSVFKMLLSIIHWQVTTAMIKILILIAIMAGLFLIVLKVKWNFFQRFCVFLETSLQQRNMSFPKIILWIRIIIVSVLTACILFYGYLLIRFCASSYISSILFILLTGTIVWFIGKIILRIFKIPSDPARKTRKVVIVLFLLWFCIESLLRIEHINMTANEKNGLLYLSGYTETPRNDKQNPHLLVYPRNFQSTEARTEFVYKVKCNADGLRDIDHPQEKAENEYRIFCLGNSFTEGIGAPQDSTWPRLLEGRLQLLTRGKVTVFNAGKSNSDPFFEYMLLKEKMLYYKPDMVLLTLGSSDFAFYRYRGGFERFTKDGIRFREGSNWEKLYAVSYVFRYFYCKLNDKNPLPFYDYKADSLKAIQDHDQCIRMFYQLSLANSFKLIVVFYDDGENDYTIIMNKLKQEKMIPVIDLFEYNKDIEKLNRKNRTAYYWPLNKHCKAKGYDLMARGVEWNLKKMGLLDTLRFDFQQ